MIEKGIVLLITFGLFAWYEKPWRIRKPPNETIPYFAIVGFALYLGADFASDVKLPHVDELLDALMRRPVLAVSDFLRPPSE